MEETLLARAGVEFHECPVRSVDSRDAEVVVMHRSGLRPGFSELLHLPARLIDALDFLRAAEAEED